jgi:hypothetical protein
VEHFLGQVLEWHSSDHAEFYSGNRCSEEELFIRSQTLF